MSELTLADLPADDLIEPTGVGSARTAGGQSLFAYAVGRLWRRLMEERTPGKQKR